MGTKYIISMIKHSSISRLRTFLCVRVDIDITRLTLLPHVSPAVGALPLATTLRTLVLAKSSLVTLIRSQPT